MSKNTKTAVAISVATVSIKAAGVVRDIDVSTLHPDAIDVIFTYGLRRWVQDSVNAQTKVARDEEAPFDADAVVDDRIKQAVDGAMSTRGRSSAAVTTETAYNRRAVRQLARANADLATKLKAAKEAGPDAVNAILDQVATDNPDIVRGLADDLRKADEKAEADRKALASGLSL